MRPPADASTRDAEAGAAGRTDGGLHPIARDGGDATTEVDAALPPRLDDVCFRVGGAPGELRAPESVGRDGGWVVGQARVALGEGGFGLWLRSASGAEQAVYMDAAGGCVRPISPVLQSSGPSCGMGQPVVRGGTLAALEGCAYKGFSAGSALYRNGVRSIDLSANPSGLDLYGDWTHDIAVASDGSLFVATGPSPTALGGPRGLGAPPPPDRLMERWVKTSGAVSGASRSDSPEAVISVDVVEGTSFRGVVLAFRERTDGGLGASFVELQNHDFGTVARWNAPPGVSLTGVAARGDAIGLMGETTVSGERRAWFGVLTAPDLTVRWQSAEASGTGLPFGVGLDAGGSLFAGTQTDGVALVLLARSASGTSASQIGSYAAPDGGSFGPTTFGVTRDGALLLAVDKRIAVLPVPAP